MAASDQPERAALASHRASALSKLSISAVDRVASIASL
jgi:hypothetical protein